MIPTLAHLRVGDCQNIQKIDITFNRNKDHVVLSNPGSNEGLSVHKDQIDDLRQALDDCRSIFTEIEDRQAAEEEVGEEID